MGEQMHGLEPQGQRKFGVLENRSGLWAGLLAALLALKDTSGQDGAVFSASTTPTYKSIRPTGVQKGYKALLLCPVLGVELTKGQPLLELNPVFDLGKHAGKLHSCLKYGSIKGFLKIAEIGR